MKLKTGISSIVLIFHTIAIVGCSEQNFKTQETKQMADVVYTNGKIYTVDEDQPWAEAVAIDDGKFLVVGSNADVKAVTDEDTEVVDL